MIETLREEMPEKESWEKRQQAVLVYKAADFFLRRKNRQNIPPSEEEVFDYVQLARERTHVMERLNRKVKDYRGRELLEEVGFTNKSKNAISIEKFRRARRTIKERYLAIDKDPAQNRAILDPILFPDG